MPDSTYTVRCRNPLFAGEAEGVPFERDAGGAVGEATREQAKALVGRPAFHCQELTAEAIEAAAGGGGEEQTGKTSGSKLDGAPMPAAADAPDEGPGEEPAEASASPSGTETDEEARSEAFQRLLPIDGVGKVYAFKLARAGVEGPGALRAAVASEVAERSGISQELIEDWQAQLKDAQ